jgi:hypothetical protein
MDRNDQGEGMRLASQIEEGRRTGSAPPFTIAVLGALLVIAALAAWRVLF